MSDSVLQYEKMVEDALRTVVREALQQVIANGGRLIGSHHFFIGFRTDYPGVHVAPRIRAQYPEEMTIVIQHQFWDLQVDERGFSISLTFGGVPETLYIPFAAILGFHDPAAEFILEFQVDPPPLHVVSDPADTAETKASSSPNEGAQVITLDAFRKK